MDISRDTSGWEEVQKLKNCPITRKDIIAAEDIFGPDHLGSLKGKTVRRPPGKVNTDVMVIPAAIMDRYREVTLGGDIMKISKIPFMVTISSSIRFGTMELVTNQMMMTLAKAIGNVAKVYMQRGSR
ncbi:MAG TPA: hypothetical protein V6D20_08555 [Candidatus Obscuribacterales bacterium]